MLLFYTLVHVKKATNHYLSFTRKERTGIFVLLTLIVLITFIPFLYPVIFKEKIIENNKFDDDITSLKVQQFDSNRKNLKREYDDDNYRDNEYPRKPYNRIVKGIEFEFDPNTISMEGWRKLGIREKTIVTIGKYLAKGGRFREANDLKNIWGLHEEDVERLMPFVRIKEHPYPLPGNATNDTKVYTSKNISPVDVNTSDTAAFIALPGIGSKLSMRITSFRQKLGGFYSIDQVGETFGLPDSVFQKIRSSLLISGEIRKININKATVDEMKVHPYIRYNLANAIVQYRTQNGAYSSVTDIKKIMIVDEALYKKLSPYLVVE